MFVVVQLDVAFLKFSSQLEDGWSDALLLMLAACRSFAGGEAETTFRIFDSPSCVIFVAEIYVVVDDSDDFEYVAHYCPIISTAARRAKGRVGRFCDPRQARVCSRHQRGCACLGSVVEEWERPL